MKPLPIFRRVLPLIACTLVNYPLTSQGIPTAVQVSTIVMRDSTIYVATYDAGVIRSTDLGITWNRCSEGVPTSEIWSFAVEESCLFVGTSQGVYRSTDGGLEWSPSNAGLTDPNIYGLFAKDTIVLAGTWGGIFRSTDRGATWNSASAGLSGEAMYVMTFAAIGNTIFSGTGGGIYLSDNLGANWWLLTTGSAPGLAVWDSVLYATRGAGIGFSTNLGTTWQQKNFPAEYSSFGTISVAASPTHIFAGTAGSGLLESPDSGTTWSLTSNGLTNQTIIAIAASESVVFVGTGGGLFRSNDSGSTWNRVVLGTGLGKVQSFVSIGSTIYAGTAGGVFRSFGDTAWIPINNGLRNTDAAELAAVGSEVFAGIRGGGVFRLIDSTATWTSSSFGLTDTVVEALLFRDSVLFAGTNASGVFRSLDSGATWVPTTGMEGSALRVLSFAANDSLLFVGTEWGVGVSSDNGLSWSQRSNGIWFGFHEGLAFLGDTLFATSGSGGGIYRTTDWGENWSECNTGLSNWFVNSIVSFPPTLYAGTQNGLYVSSDGGDSWQPSDSTFTDKIIFSLFVVGDEMLVGTGSEIFRISLNGTPVLVESSERPVPLRLSIFPNYPNPFNPSTTLEFELSEVTNVYLRVFDMLGREVATYNEGRKEAGRHRRTISAAGWSSGIYVIRLEAGSQHSSIRIVLTR